MFIEIHLYYQYTTPKESNVKVFGLCYKHSTPSEYGSLQNAWTSSPKTFHAMIFPSNRMYKCW